MAALYIHSVKARDLGKPCKVVKLFFVGFKLIVRQNSALVNGFILKYRVIVGDQRLGIAVGL